jgi:hypothetical protein
MSKQEQTEQEARSVARINWSAEPLESQLADLTLWPGQSAFLIPAAVLVASPTHHQIKSTARVPPLTANFIPTL